MPDAGEEVLAFPDTQARQLAGVSMRRLRYWEQVGLIVPSIKRRLSDHNTVRLYPRIFMRCSGCHRGRAARSVVRKPRRLGWLGPGWVVGSISQAAMSDGETVHSEQVQLAVPDVVNAAQDLV